jgi:hypothetical protein
MGRFLSRCFDRAVFLFSFSLSSSFFVRLANPVSSPRPTQFQCRRAQGLSRTALLQRRRRLVLDWPEHAGRLDLVEMMCSRGARFRTRSIAPQPCIRSITQSGDLNHDAPMRIGSEAPRRRTHSAQRHDSHGLRGTPPPRTVIGDLSLWSGSSRNCQSVGDWRIGRGHQAGRIATPSGTTPSRTNRHRAISSLRARATIMVLRVLGAFSVRSRYHCARALSFWNSRNRHAS